MAFANTSTSVDGYSVVSRFQVIKTSTVQTITASLPTTVEITWDAEQFGSSDYSYTPGASSVTINADGDYKVSFNVNFDTQSNSRVTLITNVYINGTANDSTYSVCYFRHSTTSEESCKLPFFEIPLSDGDVLTVEAGLGGGTSDVDTLLDGSILRIERIESN